MTSWVFDESLPLICSTVSVNRPVAVEDARVLSEETEDEPRHEMVHVVAALARPPLGVVLQQLDVEPVQAARGPDVEGIFGDLLDGGDAGERQEEAEMVGKVLVGAGDRLAAREILGLEIHAVGREDELCLGLGGGGARLQSGQRPRYLSRRRKSAIWMLLVCRTPPRSDLFDAPARSA